MLAAIALAFCLQGAPPVTRHFILHPGAHATVRLHHRIRTWWLSRGGVVDLNIANRDATATARIDATAPGGTAITVGSGDGLEVWLVDVRDSPP